MKNIYSIIIGCSILLAGCKTISQVSDSGLSHARSKVKWNLVFEDQFNSKGNFDESKWGYSKRGNAAWMKYLTSSPEYVYQDGKNLVLRMDNKVIEGDDALYHSAGIQTKGKFSFLYGKVEVRAKFKTGKGSWPAIWMMPENSLYGDWPNSGEIDIMEHVNNENVIHQTIHNGSVTNKEGGSTATDNTLYKVDDYNIYGVVWTSDSIQFFVNNILQYTYTKSDDADSKSWPFDQPFYLILNQSGGLGWPGKLDEADLPFYMHVDWVRVYQEK